ncbi:hypothetical protein F2P81_017777 [Scophthalmus maximus]|uniref:Uncharacterized protein n=1 Tax=Scophthalmus maximus TaxID=52904 RepID=A0A6A4SDN0_SCOMX|nr:hypothetical protein F2P81_017777 [Scophthalmus maximus]
MMVGNVSVLTLTRPKQILTQTRKKIYSKPARNKIGATDRTAGGPDGGVRHVGPESSHHENVPCQWVGFFVFQ